MESERLAMKKVYIILFLIVIGVSSIGFYFNQQNKQEDIGNRLTGGYGSHLQHLECAVDHVEEMAVFVIANTDAYEPETFKKGDMIKLNFALAEEPTDPKNLNLSKGQLVKLTYLTIDETHEMPEVSMRYPSSLFIKQMEESTSNSLENEVSTDFSQSAKK